MDLDEYSRLPGCVRLAVILGLCALAWVVVVAVVAALVLAVSWALPD